MTCAVIALLTSFSADVTQIGAVKAIRKLDDCFIIDFTKFGDFGGVDLENIQARLLIWQGNF